MRDEEEREEELGKRFRSTFQGSSELSQKLPRAGKLRRSVLWAKIGPQPLFYLGVVTFQLRLSRVMNFLSSLPSQPRSRLSKTSLHPPFQPQHAHHHDISGFERHVMLLCKLEMCWRTRDDSITNQTPLSPVPGQHVYGLDKGDCRSTVGPLYEGKRYLRLPNGLSKSGPQA